MKKKLIGLTGKKGSGKDSVADWLIENKGYIKMSFAKRLKDTVRVLFNLSEDAFTIQNKEKILPFWSYLCRMNVTPRLLLQKFGTECMRNLNWFPELKNAIGNDFWTVMLEEDIQEHLTRTNVVIADCRFDSEAEFIKKLGGKIININCIDKNIYSDDVHESEKGVSEELIDYDIYSKFGLDNLYEVLKTVDFY